MSTLTHDIKGCLSTIISCAELLQYQSANEDVKNDSQQKVIDIMLRTTLQLESMLEGLSMSNEGTQQKEFTAHPR